MTQTAQRIDGRTKAGRAMRAEAQSASSAHVAAMNIDYADGMTEVVEDAPVVQRQPSRAAARLGIRDEAPREAPRASARGAVLGRSGEVLSRKRAGVGDPFDVKSDDPNYEFQWIAHTVAGNADVVMDQNLNMLENGWRPVPASRFPGRFMPAGTSPGAHIMRGGQGLYERPKSLCEQARAEDVLLAKQLISDRNDALKLSGVKNGLGQGFEMNKRYRGTGGSVKMDIDPALDIPAPSHTLAEAGE